MYEPDRFVILKLNHEGNIVYKVFAGWSGGYLDSASWKINSGITKVELDGDYYLFQGYSGSTYKCHKNSYGMTGYMSHVLPDSDKIEIMEDQDFTKLLEEKSE